MFKFGDVSHFTLDFCLHKSSSHFIWIVSSLLNISSRWRLWCDGTACGTLSCSSYSIQILFGMLPNSTLFQTRKAWWVDLIFCGTTGTWGSHEYCRSKLLPQLHYSRSCVKQASNLNGLGLPEEPLNVSMIKGGMIWSYYGMVGDRCSRKQETLTGRD